MLQDPNFHDGYTPIRPRIKPGASRQPRSRSTIVVTDRDQAKLNALLDEQRHGRDAALVRCLDVTLSHAFVIAAHRVAPDIVTMNSAVLYEDPQRSAPSLVQLVYSSCGYRPNRVSVLSPLGIALLGAQVGQQTMWSMPTGRVRRLRVTGLLYQPERSGDFHL